MLPMHAGLLRFHSRARAEAGSLSGLGDWPGDEPVKIRRVPARRQGHRRDHQVSIRSARAAEAPVRPEVVHPDRRARAHLDR